MPFGRDSGGETQPGDLVLRAKTAGDFTVSSEQ